MEKHNTYPSRSEQVISLEKGKLPPQSVDLEEVVLGGLMINTGAVDEVMDFLKAEFFYKEAHKYIFEAINNIYERHEGVDLLTTSTELRHLGKLDASGGEFYLVQLTQKVSSTAHIQYHSRIILQSHLKREMIKNANITIEDAYDETVDVFDLIDESYERLNTTSEIQTPSKVQTPKSLVAQVIQKGKDIFAGKIKPGIETPIKRLTDRAGGWRDGEFIVMAGRPGMGKTAFALLSAAKPAFEGTPTAFFSLEMSIDVLVSRLIAMEAELDTTLFNTHGLDDFNVDKIELVRKKIEDAPLYIDDSSNLSIKDLRIKTKRLVNQHDVKMVVVDYLQLMHGVGNNREQEISNISRGLKLLAHELNIPVIALSQLSRGVESRGGTKRPLLSDLRESGAIEQDADLVMFFYRPEYYRIMEWDDYGGGPTIGEAEYIVAKNRNGGLVRNRMKFEAKYTKFSELAGAMDSEDDQKAIDFKEEDDDDLPF